MSLRPTALLFILFAPLLCLGAQEVPRPLNGTFVHDFAGVIPADREVEIGAKARRLRDEYKTEIAVVTVDSLGGEESFDYSMRVARSWGIGSKDNEVRGLLILVAVKDRKTAFRTSRHVEGELPDGVTGGISREMNAYFKGGDFGGGLSLGMDRILDRMKEVYEPQPAAAAQAASGSGAGWSWLPVVGVPALGLVGYLVWRRRRRKRIEAARQAATSSGFRDWAEKVDPSPVPEAKPGTWSPPQVPRPTRKTKQAASSSANRSSSSTSASSWFGSSSGDHDSGSSSSDSGSSYSGGDDFGGGGSDSGW